MAHSPLNALHAFLAVARHRGFAPAATALGLTPSALSQAVRQLEERLGVALLTRTTRSVALTDAGRRLLETAGPGVDQALEALKTAVARPGEVTGRVRLSVPPLAVRTLMAPLLPRFLALHPRVDVEVRVENRCVNIVAEELDAGIRLTESIERDMVQIRLFEPSRFVVVGSPAYLERRGVPAKPKDLLSHACICIRSSTTGGLYQWELERGQEQWRLPVEGPVTTHDETLMLDLAEAGVGLAYTFEPSAVARIRSGALKVVLEPFAAEVEGLFLYFPSRAQVSPALRAFVDVARQFAVEQKAAPLRRRQTSVRPRSS
ncbi:LysR family transcriptional regulator [Myxococcus sp. 1LA]